ncbi:pyridoxal phosphate-dependent aminotransferase [bacterium]|nr:MAG: pyridoxal phosphate-dependent aminotransferase [bacterium]
MRLSSRAAGLAESQTLRLWSEVARLRAAGEKVVSLLEGEPDLPVAEPVLAAVQGALKSGATRYSQSAGLPELRAAIAKKLLEENGVPAAPEDVLVTNGAKQALYTALQALVGPGDEVLVPGPCWVTFPEAVNLAGAEPVLVPTKRGRPEPEAFARMLNARTRAIVLNSPNNPTGAVYTKEELEAIMELAGRRGLWIVSDEAYERLTYDGRAHVSPASLGPKAAERTVTVQTFSKSFSMTGFRVGYLAGPRAVVDAASRIQGHLTGNVCTFAQHGGLAALSLPAEDRETRRAAYEKRRDLAYGLGAGLFDCLEPQGGLFLWADARRHLKGDVPDTNALAKRFLERGKVAVLPGSACGAEGFLRISFSASEADIREGFARMERSL